MYLGWGLEKPDLKMTVIVVHVTVFSVCFLTACAGKQLQAKMHPYLPLCYFQSPTKTNFHKVASRLIQSLQPVTS